MPKMLDFISFVPWTAIVMVLNLYILYRIVRKLLFKPVNNILQQRQQEVDAIYENANAMQQEAERKKLDYTAKLESAGQEAEQIVAQGRERSLQEQKNIQRTAQQEAKKLLEKAEAQGEQIRKDAVARAQEEISDLAVKIAEAVIEKEMDENNHQRLIDGFIGQIHKEGL